MKIAMVVNTLERGFAIPNCVENLTRWYNRLGHTAKIFTFKKTESFYDAPIQECHFQGHRIPISFLEHPIFRWIAFSSLFSRLRNFKPDIVNVDYTPLDWHVSLLRKMLRFKMSYTYYGVPPEELYEGELKKEKAQRKQKMLQNLKKADIVLSISHFLKKELDENDIPSDVIPVGIDTQHFSPEKKLPGVQKNSPVILHVGRIVPHKGFEDLVRIIEHVKKEFPSIRVYLVGRHTIPEYLNKIQSMCHTISENVFFTGFVPDTLMPYFHALADVFISTSRWEGSGTVLLEAQSCGVPVVAYNAHSFPEFVLDGKTGVLVEEGHPEIFASEIVRLLKERHQLENVKQLARKYAEQFDWKFTAEKTLQQYTNLLSGR